MASYNAGAGNGSSPRARGTLFIVAPANLYLRFIPAGAGNTARHAGVKRADAVHPRGRGEHSSTNDSSGSSGGSSPRARGTPIAGDYGCTGYRFIPAGAGNTGKNRLVSLASSVHPRGRGEHERETSPTFVGNGSSPRARGTLIKMQIRDEENRFIPAGAGNTLLPVITPEYLPVHPRGRGEHANVRHYRTVSYRFIPAGAGNTNWQ